jgi:hypothetical protein
MDDAGLVELAQGVDHRYGQRQKLQNRQWRPQKPLEGDPFRRRRLIAKAWGWREACAGATQRRKPATLGRL